MRCRKRARPKYRNMPQLLASIKIEVGILNPASFVDLCLPWIPGVRALNLLASDGADLCLEQFFSQDFILFNATHRKLGMSSEVVLISNSCGLLGRSSAGEVKLILVDERGEI